MAHIFQCKAKSGQLVPTSASKQALLKKLLDHIERSGDTITVTIDQHGQNINEGQHKLYFSFIDKAAKHFGTDRDDMRATLQPFHPKTPDGEIKHIDRWDTREINDFIDQASAHLAGFGFHF